jgi:hypothetical protein
MICIAIITLDAPGLDKPNKLAGLVADATAQCAPTICPLRQSDVSHFAVLS